MTTRKLALQEQPRHYLDGYERALRSLHFTEDQIQGATAVLVEIMLGLMKGNLRTQPQFVSLDKRNPGFSFFMFVDDVVEGLYSSSADKVYLEYISFTFDDQDVDALLAILEANDIRLTEAA